MTHLPTALPTLAAGAHMPDEGEACIMEYVSLLAGEDWSDSPQCTHPLLAFVARRTNDALSDERRSLLVPLIGRLFGTAPTGPLEDQEHVIARMRMRSAHIAISVLEPHARARAQAWIELADSWCDDPERADTEAALRHAREHCIQPNDDGDEHSVSLSDGHAAVHGNSVAAVAYACHLLEPTDGAAAGYRVAQAYACVAEAAAHTLAAQGACMYDCGADGGPEIRRVRALEALIDEHDLWTGHSAHQVTDDELAKLTDQVEARSAGARG